MKTEHQKMLAGELYDPLDPELVAGRDRARDLCQELNATREARAGGAAAHPARAVRRGRRHASGCSRRSSATTARTSCSASGCSSTSTASCSTSAAVRSATSRCSARRCRSTRRRTRSNAELRRQAGVRQADRDRLGRVGRRRGDHLPGREDRLAGGDRRRAAWSRGTSPTGCSRPATPAASSARSPSRSAHDANS